MYVPVVDDVSSASEADVSSWVQTGFHMGLLGLPKVQPGSQQPAVVWQQPTVY